MGLLTENNVFTDTLYYFQTFKQAAAQEVSFENNNVNNVVTLMTVLMFYFLIDVKFLEL